jgi:outer membrane protein TolC
VLNAQENTDVLSPEIFISIVKANHPISYQTEILNQRADEEIKKSRGSLDPYLYSNYSNKYYSDKEYFNLFEGGLKIPTWYGVEFKAAYVDNSGTNLNPENQVDPEGMWYAGVSVPLGQGLVIDKRRSQIRKAQLLSDYNEYERITILGDLYYLGLQDYWMWVESYNVMMVYEEANILAKTRFEGVKSGFFNGDKSAIDTLEALIQFQNRQVQLNDAKLDFRNKTLELSNHLWTEDYTPVELSESIKAPIFEKEMSIKPFPVDSLFDFLNSIEQKHPELLKYDNKLKSFEISTDLSRDKLKPKINLNYNILSKKDNSTTYFNTSNYKWGLEFAMPIFLREARGELRLNKFKIQETQFQMQQKTLELKNKIKNSYNKQQNIISQFTLYKSSVEYYRRLLAGEQEKFRIGESSLFLVNSRENKLIEAQLKFIELLKKYNMSNIEILHSSGILFRI